MLIRSGTWFGCLSFSALRTKKIFSTPLDRSKIQKVEEKMRLRMERVLNHNIHLVVVVSGWIPERWRKKFENIALFMGRRQAKVNCHPAISIARRNFFVWGIFFWQWLGIKNIDVAARICNITLPTPPTLQKLPWRDQVIMLLGPSSKHLMLWKTLQSNLKLKLLAVVKLHKLNT